MSGQQLHLSKLDDSVSSMNGMCMTNKLHLLLTDLDNFKTQYDRASYFKGLRHLLLKYSFGDSFDFAPLLCAKSKHQTPCKLLIKASCDPVATEQIWLLMFIEPNF